MTPSMPTTTDDADDAPDYTDPVEEAARVAATAREAGAGVAHDELLDAKMDAANARQRVTNMYVTLDSLCDDRGLLPGDVATDLRAAQTMLQTLGEWLDAYHDALADEYDTARADLRAATGGDDQ